MDRLNGFTWLKSAPEQVLQVELHFKHEPLDK